MQFPTLLIGLRYTRAKQKNHYVSFISLASMLGVAVGVLALITVLSVMNGFEKELRERILGMVPHATIYGLEGTLINWKALQRQVAAEKEVLGVAPFIEGQGMLNHGGMTQGILVQGVLPELEKQVSNLITKVVLGSFSELQAGQFKIILGKTLAQNLGVSLGDKVTLVIPEASVTPVGIMPRFKRFTVAGIFEVGYQYDSSLAYIHLDDAAHLFLKESQISGLHLRFSHLYAAPRLVERIAQHLPRETVTSDWTREHGNYFEAIKLEKTIMFLMLLLIIAVAAFNIVSTLVMVVNDKKSEIAILRTLGATPRFIMKIFMVQGSIIGIVGTILGVLGGVILAWNVTDLVAAIERVFHVQFLSSDVYYISFLPSDLHMRDVWVICITSLAITFLATIYPAWRAARLQPAEALRYE